jgi:hypothetical protein
MREARQGKAPGPLILKGSEQESGGEGPRQLLAERHARAVQARLHRGHGFPEHFSRLLVGHTFDIAEDQHSSVVFRQGVDGAVHRGTAFLREQRLFGRPGPVGEQKAPVSLPVRRP